MQRFTDKNHERYEETLAKVNVRRMEQGIFLLEVVESRKKCPIWQNEGIVYLERARSEDRRKNLYKDESGAVVYEGKRPE